MEDELQVSLLKALDVAISAKKTKDDEKLTFAMTKLKYRIFQVIFKGKEHRRLELLTILNRLVDEGLLTPSQLGWIITVYLHGEPSFDVRRALMSRILKWNARELLTDAVKEAIKEQLLNLSNSTSADEMDKALVEYLPQLTFRLFQDDPFPNELINVLLKSKHPHQQELVLKILSHDAQFRHISPEKAVVILDTLFRRINIIVYQRLARQPDKDLIQWFRNLSDELEEDERHELLAKLLPFSALFSDVIGSRLLPMLLFLGRTMDKETLKQMLQYLGKSHLWKGLNAHEKEALLLRLEERGFPFDRAGIVMAIEGTNAFQ